MAATKTTAEPTAPNKASSKGKPVGLADNIAGKIKRGAAEITGRPDLVIEGEARNTGCVPENTPSGDDRLLRPRHENIGITDEIAEHEDERVNPARKEGSASGAAGDKPSGPSNQA